MKLCIKLDLFGRELVAIDGSKFKAVNSKDRNFSKKKLEERILRIEGKIAKYMKELDENDASDEVSAEKEFSVNEIKEIIKRLNTRKAEYESISEELKQTGETQKSLTDPDSRKMPVNSGFDICYNIQTAVDGKNGLIAEFKVTNEANDNAQLFNVANAAKEILDVDAITATADKGYENATIIAECLRENITPQVAMNTESIHICIETEEEINKPGQHLNGRCIYDKKRNIVICPMGEILKPSYYHKSKNSIAFKNAKACKNCGCKCTIEAFKKFEMAAKKEDFKREYDATNLKVKQIEIKPDKNILKKRKCLSEHPFGIIKRCLDSGYCLTKGIDNVRGEFSLAFLAFNLKRAVNIWGVKKMMQEICRI